MVFQWMRLPAADAAGTADAGTSTTETQVGSGLTVPSWARAVWALVFHKLPLALTTKELVNGYVRVINDEETLEPMNFPAPQSVCLTGAIGTHVSPLSYMLPCMHDLTPNDTLRVYFAEDADLTGLHLNSAYLLLSDKKPPFQMHAQKSSVITGPTSAGTAATAVTVSTIAGKIRSILGVWNSLLTYPTAAESTGGFLKLTTNLKGWLTQRIPFGVAGSGLSTQVTPLTKPTVCLPMALKQWCDGINFRVWPDPFPVSTKEDITVTAFIDSDDTVATSGRAGIIWQE